MVSLLKRGPQLFNDNITTMAEDLKKKSEEQLQDEQLDEVSGGAPIPSCNCGQGTKTVQEVL